MGPAHSFGERKSILDLHGDCKLSSRKSGTAKVKDQRKGEFLKEEKKERSFHGEGEGWGMQFSKL